MEKGRWKSRIQTIILSVLLYFFVYNISDRLFLFFFGERMGQLFCLMLAAAVTLPFILWAYRKTHGTIRLGFRWEKKEILPNLLMIGCVAAAGVLLNLLFTRLGLLSDPSFQQANQSLTDGSLWVKILCTAVLTPLLEEILYRGIVFDALLPVTGTAWAVLLSSLLFGGMHFNMVQFVYAFLIAILLSIFYRKSGKLSVPILGHGLTNLLVIFLAG